MRRYRAMLALLSATAVLQLGLLWVQGAQLYRQNQLLSALRGDVQDLSEAVDQLAGDQGDQEPESWSPARHRHHHRARLLRVRQENPPPPQEEDPSAKELRDSRDSAKKAVQEARQAQQKLSITEAAKRAEEQEKVKAAENAWMKWVWGALGLVIAALLLRGWWRNRG